MPYTLSWYSGQESSGYKGRGTVKDVKGYVLSLTLPLFWNICISYMLYYYKLFLLLIPITLYQEMC